MKILKMVIHMAAKDTGDKARIENLRIATFKDHQRLIKFSLDNNMANILQKYQETQGRLIPFHFIFLKFRFPEDSNHDSKEISEAITEARGPCSCFMANLIFRDFQGVQSEELKFKDFFRVLGLIRISNIPNIAM